MKKKIRWYTLFFLVLIIVFYVAAFWGTDAWRAKLPVLTQVKPFKFLNQDGNAVSEQDVQNKVYVAEYFFTTCKGICPKMNRNMEKVYDKFKGEENFLILSHTVDPERDSSARLKHYADSLKVDVKKWWFLTGTKDDLYSTARQSYLLDDQNNNKAKIEEQFIHTQLFALVDKQKRVRGIYDGLKEEELLQLMKDIKTLLGE
ncbi:MAG: SCO family protein [Sphingobacteriales bacterium]|nr:MAG: SCO family protein [Sphingobacteriales bacterium]